MATFQKLLSRRHTTLVDSIILSAWNDEKRFKKVASFPDYVQNLEIIDGDFYFDTEWIESIISKYLHEKPSFFMDFTTKGYVVGDRLVSFAKSIERESYKSIQVFKESIELFKDLMVFLPETHPLVKAIEKNLTSVLSERKFTSQEVQELLLDLSVSSKLNGPALEVVELNSLKNNKWRSDDEKEIALNKHTQKFGYLGYREPFSSGYSVEFFRKRLDELTNASSKNIFDDSSFGRTEKIYVDLLREYVFFRNYRTEKMYEALYYLEPFWQAISVHLGLGSKDIFYYLSDEVSELLQKGTKIDSGILNIRRKGYALLLHNNMPSIITGEELNTYKIKKEDRLEAAVHAIKGMSACKGIAKGRVRIVLVASEQMKIETGDILVTSMTTPDFIPCMQKAAGFVTDEGGITCHAAIIAREMKKPCIIGTKSATRLLKDGDMVELDADKGVVKIINR